MITSPAEGASLDALADAVLMASRALVQTVADALDKQDCDLNLSEFSALALIDRSGDRRLIDIAAALDVTASTATRIADRLSTIGLVGRERRSRDRREIYLVISPEGSALVAAIFEHRRAHMSESLRTICSEERSSVVGTLLALSGDIDEDVMRTA